MPDVLTGTAWALSDFDRVRLGDLVTIVVDGWQAEQLTLTVTEMKAPLDRYTKQAWIYGIDAGGRVRLVLARCAPRVVGRAPVRKAA